MKRLVLTLIALSSFALHPGTLRAQTLHALLFVNEKEKGRETDRTENMRSMINFWQEIAGAIGYDYECSRNSDTDFTAARVKHAISALRVGRDDIVVFYYSGHGYNDNTNVWPTLSLNDENFRAIDVLKLLKRVNTPAKLTLCIADCCNKVYSSDNVNVTYATNESAIRKLFTNFNGKKTVMASSSKQGQLSWSNSVYGAYFGIAFRNAVSNTGYDEAEWDAVMENAKRLTMKYTKGQQEPQYSVTQTSDPFE